MLYEVITVRLLGAEVIVLIEHKYVAGRMHAAEVRIEACREKFDLAVCPEGGQNKCEEEQEPKH